MNARDALLGDRSPRIRAGVLALALPILASVAFLLEYDLVLGFWPLSLALGIALYAGLARAGILAGLGAVFLAILWRFVVPPLVGYLRWSMDTRYTPPRLLAYKLDPPGELQEGLTHGPLYALAGALVLGGLAYLIGVGVRKVAERTS
ncbi:hypothetical protein [Halostagnicola bangensis]